MPNRFSRIRPFNGLQSTNSFNNQSAETTHHEPRPPRGPNFISIFGASEVLDPHSTQDDFDTNQTLDSSPTTNTAANILEESSDGTRAANSNNSTTTRPTEAQVVHIPQSHMALLPCTAHIPTSELDLPVITANREEDPFLSQSFPEIRREEIQVDNDPPINLSSDDNPDCFDELHNAVHPTETIPRNETLTQQLQEVDDDNLSRLVSTGVESLEEVQERQRTILFERNMRLTRRYDQHRVLSTDHHRYTGEGLPPKRITMEELWMEEVKKISLKTPDFLRVTKL